MKLLLRATDTSYRAAIGDEANQGRLPLARLTYGLVTGIGWGFLHPWAQQALFPAKGTPFGIGHPDRPHERFILVRLRPTVRKVKHPRHAYAIEGRFWEGLAWRAKWGKRFGVPRFRRVLLDPDRIDSDPNANDDYGLFV